MVSAHQPSSCHSQHCHGNRIGPNQTGPDPGGPVQQSRAQPQYRQVRAVTKSQVMAESFVLN